MLLLLSITFHVQKKKTDEKEREKEEEEENVELGTFSTVLTLNTISEIIKCQLTHTGCMQKEGCRK